jgi:hypothetical protein
MVRLELIGPFKKNAMTNQAGDSLSLTVVEQVTPEQANAFAKMVNPVAAAQLAQLALPAIGIYNGPVSRFEIRWLLPRGGYYRLSSHLDQCVDGWRLMARYYGFPECCVPITAWQTLENFQASRFCGTGFIPCPTCYAQKKYQTLRKEIAARRICPTPFPQARSVHDEFLTVQAIVEGRLVVPLTAPYRVV